jgi:hypothetical protein
MSHFCRSCGLSNFRTSRFRLPDLSKMILLHLPVRCLNCDERSYAFLPQFLKVRTERRELRRKNCGNL